MDMNWHQFNLSRTILQELSPFLENSNMLNYEPSLKGIFLIDKKSGTANTERTRAKKTAMKKERCTVEDQVT